jgi:antitoxin component YwqK of YwqJK toxin-antitoxin module
MLKLLISTFILLLALTACDSKPTGPSPEERVLAGDYEAYKELDSCDCATLTKKEGTYFDKLDSLYTGRCFTYYGSSTQKMEEKQIFKGELNGYYFVFDYQGNELTKNLYKKGKLIPNAKKNAQCGCEELKKENAQSKVKMLNGIPYTGTCFSYYPNTSAKYTEIQYKDGLINGLMIVYDQQGNLLTSTKYENGIILTKVNSGL